jgi:hypothetical protein
MKITVPPRLAPRVDELVKRHAEAFGSTVEDARRLVEIAIVQHGLGLLEELEKLKGDQG